MNIVPREIEKWVVWKLSVYNRPDETLIWAKSVLLEDVRHDIEGTTKKAFETTLRALQQAGVIVCEGQQYRLAGKTVYAPPVPQLSERDKVFVATGEYPPKGVVSHEPRF